MAKIIAMFLMKVTLFALFALFGSFLAFIIWYFLSSRATVSISSVFFWCGAAFTALGALLFGGYSEIDLAPKKRWDTAGEIDPQDMTYAKGLHHLSEKALVVLSFAGGLLMVVSWLLV